jgi:hypothetical protein
MEPRDGSGAGDDQRPEKKSTRKRAASTAGATGARKRSPKAVKSEQNGVGDTDRETRLLTAYDVKEIHRSLSAFSDDDLKQIPIVAEGTHLEQGGTYIDLAEERPSEVKVNAGVVARAGNYYVPKNRVPYTIWNRLIGEAKPGQEASGARDRSVADLSTAGQAMGDQPAAPDDTGGDAGHRDDGNRDADRAATLAADIKTWMDARQEDRDHAREVL